MNTNREHHPTPQTRTHGVTNLSIDTDIKEFNRELLRPFSQSDDGMRYFELMNLNREMAIRYMTLGEDYPHTDQLPAGLKKIIDKLMEHSDNGDLKATKEILARLLGGVIQNVHVDVSNKKYILDDTEVPQDAVKTSARIIDIDTP